MLTDGVNWLSERKNSKGIVKYSTAVEEGWRKSKDALERFLKCSKIRSSRIIRLVEEVVLSKTEHRNETRPQSKKNANKTKTQAKNLMRFKENYPTLFGNH